MGLSLAAEGPAASLRVVGGGEALAAEGPRTGAHARYALWLGWFLGTVMVMSMPRPTPVSIVRP